MKHILLVDDDEDDREFFVAAIDAVTSSANCVTMESALKALHYLQEASALPDVIFLDLNMPMMNGKQFLSQIKKEEQLKHIPVIILSTSSQEETIRESLDLGAAAFLTKPNKLSLLEASLRDILEHPSYLR